MQNTLTSVEACGSPSARQAAGEPVSVMVCAPPPAGPKAPWSLCSQALNVASHVPVAGPPGVVSMHFTAPGGLARQNEFGTPLKNPEMAASRQLPQNTRAYVLPPLPA